MDPRKPMFSTTRAGDYYRPPSGLQSMSTSSMSGQSSSSGGRMSSTMNEKWGPRIRTSFELQPYTRFRNPPSPVPPYYPQRQRFDSSSSSRDSFSSSSKRLGSNRTPSPTESFGSYRSKFGTLTPSSSLNSRSSSRVSSYPQWPTESESSVYSSIGSDRSSLYDNSSGSGSTQYPSSSSSSLRSVTSISSYPPSPPDSYAYSRIGSGSSSGSSLYPPSSSSSLTSVNSMSGLSSYPPSSSGSSAYSRRSPYGSSNGSSSGSSLYPPSESSSLRSTIPGTPRSRSRINSNISIQRIQPIPEVPAFDRINEFEASGKRSYPLPDVLPRDRYYYAGREFESDESRQSPFPEPSGQWPDRSRTGRFRKIFHRMGSVFRKPFRRRRGKFDIKNNTPEQQQQQQQRTDDLNEEQEDEEQWSD
ncbi:probable ATP-dependent RNA helicase ddx17 [Oppia nitens]|uniref:probable ATP-dependent RNA helicase ddx17 n=1 Tax=Oppia nitens TaxID=1686743 RepID=UPI0023DC5506|nr:probable ATP-dependent RNA helicase ddx17 [Oppia nitens]